MLPDSNLFKNPWVTIGLGFNCEFENSLSARQIPVTTFDHTLAYRPNQLRKSVAWHKMGYRSIESNSLISLHRMLQLGTSDPRSGYNLKFDVEGAEWDLLEELIAWEDNAFRPQIMVSELHDLLFGANSDHKLHLLREISKKYYPIHANGNNFSGLCITDSYTIYDVIEVTWLRADLLESVNSVDNNAELYSINDPLSPYFSLRLDIKK